MKTFTRGEFDCDYLQQHVTAYVGDLQISTFVSRNGKLPLLITRELFVYNSCF